MNNLINNKFDFFDKIYIFTLFFFANILGSPLLVLPIGGVEPGKLIIFILYFFLFTLICFKGFADFYIKKYLLYFILLFFLCQIIYGLYWQSIRATMYYFGLIYGLILIFFIKDIKSKYLDVFINSSTIFMFILLVGAYIGFIYHLFGGQALLHIINPDQRGNGLFLTTFSNAYDTKFIRPGGIYDEPGAFSFFICSISILRVLLKKNDKTTFILLFLGLITFSLTHLIIIICFLLYLVQKYNKNKNFFLVLLIFIIGILCIYFLFKDAFDIYIFNRINSVDRIINNNRSIQIPRVISILDIRSFFFGRLADFNFDLLALTNHTDDISSNPLFPIAMTGIIASLIYYLFLCIVSFAAIIRKNSFFIYLSIIILFFQRPYISSKAYCIYFLLFLMISLDHISKNSPHFIFKRSSIKK